MIKGFKWVRPFTPEGYVDADTIKGLIDRGDGDYYRPRRGIRLIFANGTSYDAPELRTPLGLDARGALMRLLPLHVPVVSTCHRLDPDDFGRPLCSLELPSGDLAGILAGMGYVK